MIHNPVRGEAPSVAMKKKKPVRSKGGTAANTPAVELERSPIHMLHRAGQCAADIFQSTVGAHDLTPRQFAVLATVGNYEGLSQTHLVEKTGIDRSTLADIVRRMLKKGLLQRRRTREDARAYAVRLTDEGRRVMAEVVPLAVAVDEAVVAMLSSDDRDRLLTSLSDIVTAFKVDPPSSDKSDGGA